MRLKLPSSNSPCANASVAFSSWLVLLTGNASAYDLPAMADSTTTTDEQDPPLSLKRLTAAFAQLLGGPKPDEKSAETPTKNPPGDACEISPRSIVEAVLFVGNAGGQPRTAEELANAMRDVSAEEVHQAIAELNSLYDRDSSPYLIASSPAGYRLILRDDMLRMRDKFLGRVKETKLSAAAMETLAIIAYKQPVSLTRIDQMRGGKNGSLVSSLVRRGLVRIDRNANEEAKPAAVAYRTTDRFLRVFGIGHAKELPRVAEVDN